MRNDTTDPHQKSLDTNFNNRIKNIAKLQSQSLGKTLCKSGAKDISPQKTDIKLREKILSNQTSHFKTNPLKNSDLTKELKEKFKNIPKGVEPRQKNTNDSAFVCRNSVKKAKQQLDKNECPQLNKKYVLELDRLLQGGNTIRKCNDNDSRITDGGIARISPNINKSTSISQSPKHYNNSIKQNNFSSLSTKQYSDPSIKLNSGNLPSPKQSNEAMINVKDSNTAHKVSFKTKNFSRKPVYNKISSRNSTQVAALTQKFNEIIKEKDARDSMAAVVLGCKNKSESINLKLGKNNSFIISKTGQHKKLFSINSIDGVNVKGSPLMSKKLLRVKSDSAVKRKNFSKKRNPVLGASFNHSYKSCNDQSSQPSDTKTFSRPKYKTSIFRHTNNVRTTIQKFESEKPTDTSKTITDLCQVGKTDKVVKFNIDVKPKVPEKKVNVFRTKNVVIRDGKPKMKMFKTSIIENKIGELLDEEDSKSPDTNIICNATKLPQGILKENLCNQNKAEIQEIPVLDHESSKITNFNTRVENLGNVSNSNVTQTKENDIILQVKVTKTCEDEICQNQTDIPRPNYSFLWRNTKTDFTSFNFETLTKKETKSGIYDNICKSSDYDTLFPIVSAAKTDTYNTVQTADDICPPFEAFMNKADKLLESKKREIANEMKKDKINLSHPQIPLNEAINTTVKPLQEEILEAINSLVVSDITNIRNEMMLLNADEDYETFETFKEDIDISTESSNPKILMSSQSHIKMNCPLPEVPQESTENVYQCLSEPSFDADNYKYCHEKIDFRKHGSDSDDDYDYCLTPEPKAPLTTVSNDVLPALPERKYVDFTKDFSISKSNSIASSVGYEKISSLYEKMPILPHKSHSESSKLDNCRESILNYDSGSEENIYDIIKPSDSASISNCYESITESPQSTIKMRQKHNNKNLIQVIAEKHIPFDSISNFSQSCSGSVISSDQKTNSIYEQRSITSFDRSTLVSYGKAPSEISSSDRSDDWEDMSDQENTTIVIVQEITRGKHSPTSWSRKVRHHWNKSSKKEDNCNVFVSSPSVVYIPTSKSANYYSDNDEVYQTSCAYQNTDAVFTIVRDGFIRPKDLKGLAVLKMLVLHDNAFESQEMTLLIDMDSSDNEHLYESLTFGALPEIKVDHYNDDSDSFDSVSESEHSFENPQENDVDPNVKNSRLPDPPVSTSTYTLIRFAKKMKQFTNTFTKSTRKKSTTETPKNQSPSSEISQPRFSLPKESNGSASPSSPLYQNMIYSNMESTSLEKSPQSLTYKSTLFNFNDTKPSSNNVTANDSEEKSASHKSNEEKDQSSKKTYLSFKSKFRRPVSMINGSNSNSTLKKKTNSTFYVNKLSDDEEDKNDETTKKSDDVSFQKNKTVNDSEVTSNTNGKKHSPLNLLKVSIPKIGNIRPNAPPPPPPKPTPDDKSSESKTDKTFINRSSLYFDYMCKSSEQKPKNNRISWYETGLYQPSNISTSSGTSSTMSGSGTCSTSAAFSSPSTPIPPIGMFNREPLYQFYDAAKIELACRDIDENFNLDSDIYEEIDHETEMNLPQRPSAMALVNPKNGPSRTLWCEVPEVINSSILGTMTDNKRKIQEAKFEIITSEASYLNSLTVLESQFINHPAFRDDMLINKIDKNILFGNISPVKKCSERLMSEFECCWQDNILLRGLCKVLKSHAEKYFHVYITYCECLNQLIKTLNKLKTDKRFISIYDQIQSQPACHNLSLDSFLLLPMQRITRLSLLLGAVLKNLSNTDDEYQLYADTLTILNRVVYQCNEGPRNVERIEEMKTLSCQIEFPKNIKEIQLVESHEQNKQNSTPLRWLVKSGDLTHLFWRADDQPKLTFGKKIQKSTIYLYLFTDLLVITKKKSGEDKYTVIDYCKRSLIEMTRGDTMNQSPLKESAGKYAVLLTLLENFDNKIVEMLLSCKSESDRERWLEAFSKPSPNDPNETIYEGWDCPQVAALYPYQSTQQDELSLQFGDIVNVNKKIVDGWHHGERLRDGESGWFPGNYTVEIASAHVRARNLKQKYKLLDLSGNYLNQQKKKGIQY